MNRSYTVISFRSIGRPDRSELLGTAVQAVFAKSQEDFL